jgi:hypothetical protein
VTDTDGLVVVATCDARHKAELLVELLEDGGITAVLEDGGSIGFGSKPPFGPFHVAVRSDDAESAKELVAGWWDADESD